MATTSNIGVGTGNDIPLLLKKSTSNENANFKKFESVNKTLLDMQDFIGLKLDTQFMISFKNEVKRNKIDDQFNKDTRVFYKTITDNLSNLIENLSSNNNVDTILRENNKSQLRAFDDIDNTLKGLKDEDPLENPFDEIDQFFKEDKKDRDNKNKRDEEWQEEFMSVEKKRFFSEQTKQEMNKNLEALGGPIGMIGSTIAKTLGKETFKDVFHDALSMFGSKDGKDKDGKEKSKGKKNRSQEEILDDGFDHLALLLTEEGLGADLDKISKMVEAIMDDDVEKKKVAKENLKHTKNIDKKTQGDWLTQLIAFAPMLIMLLMNKGVGGLLKDLGGIGKGIVQALVGEIPNFLEKIQESIVNALVEGIAKAFGVKEENMKTVKTVAKGTNAFLGDVVDAANPIKKVTDIVDMGKKLFLGDVKGAFEPKKTKTGDFVLDTFFNKGSSKEPKKIKDGIIGRNGEFYEPSDNDVIIATNKDLKTESYGQFNKTVESNYEDLMKLSVDKQNKTNDLLEKISQILNKKEMGNNTIVSPSINNNNQSNDVDFNSLRMLGT